MIRQNIDQDLIAAMKEHDDLKLGALRMLKSALKNLEIQKKELSEADVIGVIQNQIKQRRDSIEMFKKAQRTELAEKEEKEIEVLQQYLPEQLSEDEVRAVVKQKIVELDAKSIQEMGKVMQAVMSELKGKAEGGQISQIVKQELGNA